MENQKKSTNKTTTLMQDNKKKGSTFVPALFVVFGYLLIGCIILVSIPAPVSKVLGYETYNIVSGSMEPEISVGSAVFIKPCETSTLHVGDVVAYRQNEFIVVHRIVSIDERNQEIHTKGDANASEDMNPVLFQNVIGKLSFQVPGLGKLLFLYTTTYGKVYVISFLFAGFLLVYTGNTWKKKGQQGEKEVDSIEEGETKAEESQAGKKSEIEKRYKRVKKSEIEKRYKRVKAVIFVTAIAFLTVVAVIFARWFPYYKATKSYEEAAKTYVSVSKKTVEKTEEAAGKKCPITVDFASLQAVNPEVIGWLYCENTVINYPICQTSDNEYYLKHGYDRTELKSGSLFMETENASDFWDCNSIVYGHHMKNGSMFACLSNWQEQSYYESHPTMWLLTPNGNFEISLFAGFVTDYDSSTYTVFQGISEEHTQYISDAIMKSYFSMNEEAEENFKENASTLHTIVLSTCDYTYKDARFVLYGLMVECD